MLAWKLYGKGETPESSGIKGDHLVGKYYVLFDKEYKKQIQELVNTGHEKTWAEQNAPLMLECQSLLRLWEQNDTATRQLWTRMNAWVYEGFKTTYTQLGVTFDTTYYESETYTLGKSCIDTGLAQGVFYKKENGSIAIDLRAEGLDEKIVLRADGTSVYITQDIGTAIERFKAYPDLSQLIYTVGNEQDYHFKVLFHILNRLGYSWAQHCRH
jgi:arginyl-tRNA synthetase